MSPEATCFGLRRERISIAEVLQDYRGLPNQPLAMAQKRRGKRYVLLARTSEDGQHFIRAALTGDVHVSCARFLECQTYKFAAPLDRGPIE